MAEVLSAVDGGGRTSNAITTSATEAQTWELFGLKPQAGTGFSPHFAIQTSGGFFLTAVGHGGHSSGDTIHTDARAASDWEMFDFVKIGDPGTNSTYSFEGLYANGGTGGFLNATGGGRHSDSASLTAQLGLGYMLGFTLVRQDDGTHALDIERVLRYGQCGWTGGSGYRTDTPEVNNWEKFTLIANEDDCTSHIRTYSGTYLSMVTGHPPHPPVVIDNVADVTQATRWRLWVMAFYA